MPLLPNLGDIPQAQFDKIVEAFPGDNLAEKSQSYRNWLTNRVIDRVAEYQQGKALVLIESQLPVRPADPPVPTT